MPKRKAKDYCPICLQVVSDFEPKHGGTMTDDELKRYHRDCVFELDKKKHD